MREVELKAVLDQWESRRARLEQAGARRTFVGRLEDRRFDTPTRALFQRDEVLRLRVYRDDRGARAELGWKGASVIASGYKVRDEFQTAATDPDAVAAILARLGFIVTREIDREIEQFDLGGVTVRFERYPRMDDLVEVEGPPDGIERAIAALGMARGAFTTERLPDFVARYEQRTGASAALCEAERAGVRAWRLEDA